MSEIRQMFPDEIAIALDAKDAENRQLHSYNATQRAEINRLKAKLHRAKEYCKAYTMTQRSAETTNLADGIIDIIDNAYERKAKG